MLQITHPKVASLAPSWAPYAGCTILFDAVGIMSADGNDAPEPANCLHHDLMQRLLIGIAAWRAIGFCPLPPSSLHLTAADLLHPGNVNQLNNVGRERFLNVEGRLLEPAILAKELQPLVKRSGLTDLVSSKIAFLFERMNIRGKSVLVAELQADDSTQTYQEFLLSRAKLSTLLLEELGISLPAYRPHVTLGYFANSELANAGSRLLASLNASAQSLKGRSFSYGKPKLFTFTDMASFELV